VRCGLDEVFHGNFALFSFVFKSGETEVPHHQCVTGPLVTVPAEQKLSLPREMPADISASLPRLAPDSAAPLGVWGRYRARIAQCSVDQQEACRLRFRVFNLEMGNGLLASYDTGLDQDRFDAVCDHLIVEDMEHGSIVGTYRMQSGVTARQNFGYYSAQEFCFRPYESIRSQVLELGRASIDSQHRTSEVLTLLWRSIGQYARRRGLRYLIGCSSLNSRDPQQGWAMYHRLRSFLALPHLLTSAIDAYRLPQEETTASIEVKVPKLLKTYIGAGARICSEPAWDREFGTIDFLTLLDLEELSPSARTRFMINPQ
jgi:putative hemolysin